MRSTPDDAKREHYDTERSITVTSQVRTAFNTDRLTRIAMDSLQSWTLPNGYRWVAAGEIESRQESFGGFGGAILLATFGILTVLILEFKTFKSMLIVASVIPLGVIGGMVGLYLSGYTLSFTAMIGDRRPAPARAAGLESLQPAGHRDHRRSGFVAASQPPRDTGALQAGAARYLTRCNDGDRDARRAGGGGPACLTDVTRADGGDCHTLAVRRAASQPLPVNPSAFSDETIRARSACDSPPSGRADGTRSSTRRANAKCPAHTLHVSMWPCTVCIVAVGSRPSI